MKTDEREAPIPEWKLERYLVGELDREETERIRRRAERDEELKARLTELERSDREILQRYAAPTMARRIEERLAAGERPAAPTRAPRVRRLAWVPVAAVALVAGLLWWKPGLISERIPGPGAELPAGVRAKGPAAELSLYRRTAAGSERLEDRAPAAENDLIRARYRSDGKTFGVLVSIDGRGVVTRHLPPRAAEAAPLAAGSHALDFSYELDDAPGFEIFLLASSRSAFPVDAILDALAASALTSTPRLSAAAAESLATSLRLPEGVSISTFTLIKEAGDER